MITAPAGSFGMLLAMIILLSAVGIGIGVAAICGSQFVKEVKVIEKSGQQKELRDIIWK